MNTKQISQVSQNMVIAILAVLWLLVAGLPFFFMIQTGFKKQFELLTSSVWAFPKNPTLDNYNSVLTGGNFYRYFGNSLIVVGVSVVLILLISSMASYVFARIKFRLNRPLFALIIAGLVIPVHVTLVPVYLLTINLKLYDSILALIGPYVAFNIPLSVFILTEFMRQIPHELEASARIDGAGPMRIFFSLILPLSTPGLATLAIYNAVFLWNEFVFAFVLVSSPKNRTLPLAIWDYQGQYAANVPAIMAVLTLSSLPLIAIYILGQERVVKGIMAGALRG
jgi:raffinose/stachyose/melibiose transport system permease protein